MLRIHTITSSSAAKAYYLQASDYYSQGSELVGHWGGKLANEFGLHGAVFQESFERLVDGLHPITGDQLKPRRKENQRVGIDCTWSGPKSVSVLEALTGDSDLRKAFQEAKDETMRLMEAEVQTRIRVAGADHDRPTGNMIWADFEHSTSRQVGGLAPDPHRHIHSVCMNLTNDPEEHRFKAAQFGQIVRDAPYWEAVFEARLAFKIKSLGYEIDRHDGRNWEIAGIPQSVISKFSKRTEEIQNEAERLGITDPKQKAELGAKTREAKQTGLSPLQLRQEWDRQLTSQERQAIAAVHRRETPAFPEITTADAVQYAIDHCFERKAVVPERELIRTALYYGVGSVTAEGIARELPGHGVLLRENQGRTMATTKEVYAEERFITIFAQSQRAAVPPVRLASDLQQGMLDDDQWRAVTRLVQSQDRVNLVDAAAGTGKSTMLKAFDEAMRKANQNVFYLATTTQAVDVLRREGFEAQTVARFLESSAMQTRARNSRIVVDEASLMGHREAYQLFKIAQAENLRVDLVGDSAQHGSVTRGSLMSLLEKHACIEPFQLTKIKRQLDPRYREAVECFARGQTLEGFDRLDQLGWIKEVEGVERYEMLARDYADTLQGSGRWRDLLVVSPTHSEIETITESIRSELKERGNLAKEGIVFNRLVPANLTEAERGDARNYETDKVDMIQFHKPAKGFPAGTRVATRNLDQPLPTDQAGKYQAYRIQPIRLAKGDLVRFTLGGKTLDGDHQIRNGSTYKIAGFTDQGDFEMENGWIVSKDYGHFRHGYVETSFGSQGKTVKHVLIGQSSESFAASNSEQIYVSTSRGRHSVTIYTDDKTALRQMIARSPERLNASDLLRRSASDQKRQERERKAQAFRSLLRTRKAWQTDAQNSQKQERSYGR